METKKCVPDTAAVIGMTSLSY